MPIAFLNTNPFWVWEYYQNKDYLPV